MTNTSNADLKRERANLPFSVEKLTNMLDGGKDRTARRREIEAIIQRDTSGVFSNEDNPYLHRTDRHVRALAKHVRMIELCRKLGIGNETGGEIILSEDFPLILGALGDDLPTSLHWVMFVPNIISLFDDEQQKKWLPLCRDWRMVGCYAQTELGHGSNIRALETTATFLPESKGGDKGGSWIINSPSLTSTKFWPGTLGRTANHAMVIARLIDGEGKDRGIHNFLVPLRSMADHSLLPGVKTGDIGPKIGYNVMDNGFAQFKNVKIPRRNMAMRFVSVDENGNYQKKRTSEAAQKIVYITMMQVRAHICNEAGKNLSKACTIAIRYSAVRRQGFKADGSENQVLDYKQQQHRLLPLLAASYCFFFTGRRILERLRNIEQCLMDGSKVSKAEMTDIHASSSGLKSYTTMVAADGMEECRKACGGHGFLESSGLPELITTYLQNPTVEGDNHMLPQQVAKVLLKVVEAVASGKDLNEFQGCDSFGIIGDLEKVLAGESSRLDASNESKLCQTGTLLDAFRHRAARILAGIAIKMKKEVTKGITAEVAWNNCLVEMSRMTKAYAQYLLLRDFAEGIREEVERGLIGDSEASVLNDLAVLLGLYWIEKDTGDFLEDQFISASQVSMVRQSVLIYLSKIRSVAVALVDARDFSDFRLKSALGRFDGDVYPAIIKGSLKDPLNASDIGPGYEEHLRRLYVDGAGVYTGTSSRL